MARNFFKLSSSFAIFARKNGPVKIQFPHEFSLQKFTPLAKLYNQTSHVESY